MEEHDPASASELKVSDRRHFTGSGERRHEIEAVEGVEGVAAERGSDAVHAALRTPPSAPKPPALNPAPAPPPPSERLAAREITFAGLLQDLYATGMMQLGAELQPGQPPQLDLEGARETIDLISLLQQKTRANLDAQEEGLMKTVLYELRLAYVEVQRAATSRVQPAHVVPPPPPPRRR
ncbi:MAG TPA: DUF1844 domain-containing protein [Terriglobales bacterium]|nr:DUF1844 domain-containing protein [Terriglobales bacterium]